jgi:hypothetical protein
MHVLSEEDGNGEDVDRLQTSKILKRVVHSPLNVFTEKIGQHAGPG